MNNMNNELQTLIDLFLKILHLYSVIGRKPKDYGTGDLLYFTEIHTITMVGKNNEINMTRLAEIMGVTGEQFRRQYGSWYIKTLS